MYQSLLADTSFFSLLLEVDRDLAREARSGGCPWCAGVLHRACYRRKPRGAPAGLGREHGERWSFCCAVEGCRRRVTPASVRFLGRKVYLGAVVVLAAALRDGATRRRVERLQKLLGVSRRTLERWRKWWRQTVPRTRFWRAARGRWSRPVVEEALPASLLAAFGSAALPPLRCQALRGELFCGDRPAAIETPVGVPFAGSAPRRRPCDPSKGPGEGSGGLISANTVTSAHTSTGNGSVAGVVRSLPWGG